MSRCESISNQVSAPYKLSHWPPQPWSLQTVNRKIIPALVWLNNERNCQALFHDSFFLPLEILSRPLFFHNQKLSAFLHQFPAQNFCCFAERGQCESAGNCKWKLWLDFRLNHPPCWEQLESISLWSTVEYLIKGSEGQTPKDGHYFLHTTEALLQLC